MASETIRGLLGRSQALTLLGFALFWTWTDTVLYGQALSEAMGQSHMAPEFLQLIGLGASAIVSLLVLAGRGRTMRLLTSRRAAIASLVIAGVATAAYALGNVASGPLAAGSSPSAGSLVAIALPALLVVASLCMSAAMFTFAFAAAFDPSSESPAGIVAGSIALAGLAQHLVGSAPAPVRIVLIAALPLAAAAVTWALSRMGAFDAGIQAPPGRAVPSQTRPSSEATPPDSCPQESESQHEWVETGETGIPEELLGLGKAGISHRFVLGLVVFSLAAGLIQFFYATNDPATAATEAQLRIIPRNLVAFGVFLGLVVFSWKPYVIYRVGALATIAAFVALPYFPQEWRAAAPIAANMGYTCLELIAWTLCFEAARLKHDLDMRALGICRLAMAAAAFAGVACTSLIGGSGAQTGLAAAISSTATLALTLVMVLVLDEGWTSSTWYLLEHADRQGSATDSLARSCQALAQERGLTSREEQVCGYLALGRSASYIATELGIAVSTVNFHVRHIYEKLGVGSKQELILLVENRGTQSHDA